MRRVFKRLAFGAALLFAALLAGAWWVASSPTALQWLATKAAQRSNGSLAVEGVSGSLLGGMFVHRLTYSTADVRITLEDVALEMSRDAWLHGKLEVTAEAAVADIHTVPSSAPSTPPDSLALPFDIEIKRGRIARAHIEDQSFNNLVFAYRGGSASHALRALSADIDGGRLTGDLRIAATRPFALSGQFQLEREKEWNVQLALAGDLLATDAALHGTAHGAVVDAKALIAAFDPRWLREVHVHGENINTAAFIPGAPETAIGIDVDGAPTGHGWPAGKMTVKNAIPGPVTMNRLPLIGASANFALEDSTTATLTEIAANLGGGGTASGKARIARDASRFDLDVHALNLRALHTPLRATRLNGNIKAELTSTAQTLQINVAEHGVSIALNGTRRGDVVTLSEFHAQAGAGTALGSGELALTGSRPYQFHAQINDLDPAEVGDYPQAAITGRLNVSGELLPRWRANVALALTDSLFRGAPMEGSARGEIMRQRARNVEINLAIGANTLQANGSYGRAGDVLTFALNAPRLSQLDPGLAGALTANGNVSGDATRPRLEVSLAGTEVAWRKSIRTEALQLHADGTLARHAATITARGQDFDFEASAEGGWNAASGWSGTLTSFRNTGTYPMQLLAPMPIAYARGSYTAGPARMDVDGGQLTLTALAWRDGRLDTSGEIANFPVAPLLALAGTPTPLTTLRIAGSWSLTASPLLNGRLTLVRESGDIITPGATPIALGLERFGVEARLVNGALDATLEVLAQTLTGHAHATVTPMSREGAVKFDGKFDVVSLHLFDSLLGAQALLRGNAAITVAGRGTLGALQLSGTLAADNLGIEAPQYGVRLHDGTLRAELDDKMLTLRQFSIHGDEGMLTATGAMARATGGEAHLAWRAEHLRLLNRDDIRLKVDGSGTAELADKKLVLRGALTADEGLFEFDTPKAPKLAADIVVAGRPPQVANRGVQDLLQAELLDLDVTLDAGEHLHIAGAGLDTELRGTINLKTSQQGVPEARGVLSSVRGVYFAFGQRLEIDRGRLIFDGPIDNPALDIVAKRKNLPVEAGVEVTGTVQVPNIKLTSEPPVSDSEKLAWLTLGHGLEDATSGDFALLQSAASALVAGGKSVPVTQRIANKVGLDELSLRGGGQAGTEVAAFGKRLSDRVYLEYQQSLAAVGNVLMLSYTLTRSLSLRLETGFTSGVGIYFTHAYD